MSDGVPAGEEYDWFRRANSLLAQGNPDAAAQLLHRLREVEPGSPSVLESLGRALFDSKRYSEAVEVFEVLAELVPADDYAHYGLGLALWRVQEFSRSRDELAMAAVMNPSRDEYRQALGQVRATLRARAEAGHPLDGPIAPVEPPISYYPVIDEATGESA